MAIASIPGRVFAVRRTTSSSMAMVDLYNQQWKNSYIIIIPLTRARSVRTLKVGPVIAIEAGALWTVGLHTVTVGRTGHTRQHSRGQLLNVGAKGTLRAWKWESTILNNISFDNNWEEVNWSCVYDLQKSACLRFEHTSSRMPCSQLRIYVIERYQEYMIENRVSNVGIYCKSDVCGE